MLRIALGRRRSKTSATGSSPKRISECLIIGKRLPRLLGVTKRSGLSRGTTAPPHKKFSLSLVKAVTASQPKSKLQKLFDTAENSRRHDMYPIQILKIALDLYTFVTFE